MTLTSEESSNKEWIEALSLERLNTCLRTAMEAGCITPSHVYDLVDETLDRLNKIADILRKIR